MDDAKTKKVRDIIADNLEVDPAKVVPDAALVADLGADSLDAIEIVMALEEEFDIAISDEDASIGMAGTVADVEKIVEKETAGR